MGSLIHILQGGIFVALLLTGAVVDWQGHIIPDGVSIGIFFVSLLYFEPERLLGSLVFIPFLLFGLLGAVGGGDVKLTAAAGAMLGMPGAAIGIIIALSVMVPVCWVHQLIQRAKSQPVGSYPMAPFLAIGFLPVYFLQCGGFIP